MRKNILNEQVLDRADVKRILSEGGIKRFFEHQNGKIIVQESDAVQVYILFRNETVSVKSKFPQIGNAVQIVATILLLIAAYFLQLPYPWIIAIVGGQLISFGVFYPKIKQLREKVEQVLQSSK